AGDSDTVSKILNQRGISLNLLDLLGGVDVTGDGIAKAFRGVASVFARLERDRIGERIREAKAKHRREGRHLGGSRPFGFTIGKKRQLQPVPEEQRAIRLIKRLRANGRSLRETQQRVQQRLGLSVSHITVRRIAPDKGTRGHATTKEAQP